MPIYDNVALAITYQRRSRVANSTRELILHYLGRLFVRVPRTSSTRCPRAVRRPTVELCIARALAIEPDVLLLARATSVFDPVATGKIEDLLHARPKTILWSSSRTTCSRRPVSSSTRPSVSGKASRHGIAEQTFSKPTQKAAEDHITSRFG
jgi:phosphate transport system ATP-binding protein